LLGSGLKGGKKTGAKSQLKEAPEGQPHTKIFCARFFYGTGLSRAVAAVKKISRGIATGLVTGRTL
jgi:hypothetical protein